MTQYKDNFIEYVKNCKPGSSKHKILSQDIYLDGSIANIEFEERTSDSICKEKINLWVIITRKHKGSADNESQLIQQMNIATKQTYKNFNMFDVVTFLLSSIIILSTVYFTYISDKNNPPQFLQAICISIFTFYVGRSLPSKNTSKE